MKRLLVAAFAILAFCPPSFAGDPVPATDRLILPTQRVGAVTRFSTEQDITRIFGSTNVVRPTDGSYVVLFPGRPDELRIDFRAPGKEAERVSMGKKGAWTTASGLKVGITVDELEEINGGSFDVTGVNWQIPARVVSWKGGELPPTMYVDLVPTGRLTRAERKRLTSRKAFFDSRATEILRTFVVDRIVIEW